MKASYKNEKTLTIRVSTLIIVILIVISVVGNGLYIREKLLMNKSTEEAVNQEEQQEPVQEEETISEEDTEEESESVKETKADEKETESFDAHSLSVSEFKYYKMNFDYTKKRCIFNLNYDKKHTYSDEELRSYIKTVYGVRGNKVDDLVAKLKKIDTGLLNFFFNNGGEITIVGTNYSKKGIYLADYVYKTYGVEISDDTSANDDYGTVGVTIGANMQLKIFVQEDHLDCIYHEFGHVLDRFGLTGEAFSDNSGFQEDVESVRDLIENNYREYASSSYAELFADSYSRYVFQDAFDTEDKTVYTLMDWIEFCLKVCNANE